MKLDYRKILFVGLIVTVLILIVLWIRKYLNKDSISGGNNPPSNNTPPSPPPSSNEQPTRLRVTNLSNEDIFVQQINITGEPSVIFLKNNSSYDYKIPDTGASSVRVWPKTGCDANGDACSTGQSMPPCPEGGCQPPFDSKAEFTFGDINDPNQKTAYDVSFVDGFTLPIAIIAKGDDVGSGDCLSIDCSQLTLDKCPSSDTLAGIEGADLRVINPITGKIQACLSPCQYSVQPPPYGIAGGISSDPALHMCCPTPCEYISCTDGDACNCAVSNCRDCHPSDQCTWENSCATTNSCSSSSDPKGIKQTHYYKTIKSICPNAYSYAYDDNPSNPNVLMACNVKDKYEIIFYPK